jgi:hypothetical protein
MVGTNGKEQPVTAFPLQWPAGRKRSPLWRKQASFGARHGMTLGRARDEVFHQIKLLGGRLPIFSSNLELRLDGLPYANQKQPDDPGVAVYFTYKGKQHCFASDCWNKVEDNVYAIAKTVDALRGIERWGTGDMLERAFQGFVALPNPAQWWHVLGFDATVGMTKDALEDRFRQLAMQRHPDRGGSSDAMAELNWAREKGLEHLGGA